MSVGLKQMYGGMKGASCRIVGALLLACGTLSSPAAAPAEQPCAIPLFSASHVPGMTITAAKVVPESSGRPEYCDLHGSVITTGDGADPGAADFEVKLPANWNHKFLFWGVGGLAGSLNPSANRIDVSQSLVKGYATAITDTGHQGKPFVPAWALTSTGVRNLPAIADYFYRAGHQVTVAAKQLVESYYHASSIRYSYFDGCSYGGHMGLMEAERYPNDYDAVIAGAPYLTNRTQLWGYKNAKAFLNAYIPRRLMRSIDDAIKANCDVADGVPDDLIQNPAQCSFDPDTLVPATLTRNQAAALKIYLRAVTDTTGRLVFPGSSVSDLATNQLASGILPAAENAPPIDRAAAEPWGTGAPLVWDLAEAFINYFAELDPKFNANVDWPEIDGRITPAALRLFDRQTELGNVDQADRLRTFLKKGGKILMYHGYSDPLIPPYRTIWFYQDLARKHRGAVEKQVRLFMVPGMSHCGGGPGPNSFDTLTTLENWAEKDSAPDAILATHFKNNDPRSAPDRTMPLCRFPEEARYAGTGDVTAASSWSCPGNRDLLKTGPNGLEAQAIRAAGGGSR
jgi:feruloyl esterase